VNPSSNKATYKGVLDLRNLSHFEVDIPFIAVYQKEMKYSYVRRVDCPSDIAEEVLSDS